MNGKCQESGRCPFEVKWEIESGKSHRHACFVGRTTSVMTVAHKAGTNMLLLAEFPPSYYRGALLAQEIEHSTRERHNRNPQAISMTPPYFRGTHVMRWFFTFPTGKPGSRWKNGASLRSNVKPELFGHQCFIIFLKC